MPTRPTTANSPAYGSAEQFGPQIRRVLARNPSPMTLHGTNSYLVGTGDVALIDPGPDDPAHAAALLAALHPSERISHIFVTHAHLDHSPLAQPMAQALGVKTYAFGPATAGRSAQMQALAATGMVAGGEGIDAAFAPDIPLADGETLAHGDWALTALHTPGHLSNHLCFALGDVLFSGDHVMGWASSLVSPPDGDMADYRESLHKLAATDWSILHSGHGAPITSPATRLRELIQHRDTREAAILAELAKGETTIPALTKTLYADTPPALHPAAQRNVLAHLLELTARGTVAAIPAPGPTSTFHLR
ncbi:MBL fold metallo-hydrolase [Pseudorhodobacter sp. E13]|uniref:MBL fold metallo-hydrolase n=1 Tax=Pseudorhodobacter sp. E13 TaxID=2487931 RepID=UPI000F8E048B|nr:MBL fold metallo-hydrolase [Pseudorhodobacter sp. E13]RUS59274.1 MBL fold metallo-hydrolase [Pseudorhodobacter sp. E13]